jgi:GR25 family glycosyltransferase involved in LPS biosynthesis
MFVKKKYENCIILEDDLTFTLPMNEVNKLMDRFFIVVKEYDVVMFAYSLIESQNIENQNDFLLKLNKVYTTFAYCVNKKFAKTLLENFRKGVEKLEADPSNRNFKIDEYFHSLMEKSKWV